MSNYLIRNVGLPIPQSEPASPLQQQNNAGGYSFTLDDWGQFRRWLILGSEGGTYYVSERKLTRANAAVVERLLLVDGRRLVDEVVAVSDSGRAPKNDPAILALAMAAQLGDLGTKDYARAALPKVCRTGTHLHHFVAFSRSIGKWGRGMRRAVGDWLNQRPIDSAALQAVKYQSRDGWSFRDILRLAHPDPTKGTAPLQRDALYSWITHGLPGMTEEQQGNLPQLITATEALKAEPFRLGLIGQYRIPREAVPTELLTKADTWAALVPHGGVTMLLRNLASMTRAGYLAPLSSNNLLVASKITDPVELRSQRVHPLQVLAALRTYSLGHGERGNSTWTPVPAIVDALDEAFYMAFQAVEPTGKPTLLALDVSSSMSYGDIAGIPGLTPSDASAALALVTASVEPNYHVMGFADSFRDLRITKGMRLADAIRNVFSLSFGGTDCALPMLWAEKSKVGVDNFAVYTDSETWAGKVHPHIALRNYRRTSGRNARLAVVGMTATNFTIADPSDAGMLDVVGFDTATPALMAEFFKGLDTKQVGH